MSTPSHRRRLGALFATVLTLAVTGATLQPAQAGPPDGKGGGKPPQNSALAAFDYAKVSGLSQDRYPTVKETFALPMWDGTEVHVEVTRPDAVGDFPVILEASPY
ncbi:MAG: hypothetical protein WB471_04355, partial [Nocardioides sp.]